jgi:hypothetical protein
MPFPSILQELRQLPAPGANGTRLAQAWFLAGCIHDRLEVISREWS